MEATCAHHVEKNRDENGNVQLSDHLWRMLLSWIADECARSAMSKAFSAEGFVHDRRGDLAHGGHPLSEAD